MTQPTPAVHRTIIVVDVPGFTGPDREPYDRLAVHQGMYEVLKGALEELDLKFDSCESEDRGDGALVLVPPEIPKSTIADKLPDRLVAALHRYNASRRVEARFKLRVALNSGDILHDGRGWVGKPVDDAFRILEAREAKAALAETDHVVALISSEEFYTGVIRADPGTNPEAYLGISVSVKTFNGTAWLRLLGGTGAVTPAPPATVPDVAPSQPNGQLPEQVPYGELDNLRERLIGANIPRLQLIMGRAVGSVIPLPPHEEVQNAWDALWYLAEFNAGPDGIPPALLFLELLASEMDDDVGKAIANWVNAQAQRLRRVPALEARRPSRTPIPAEPHLHLTIMIKPDEADPDRCLLAYWRQDDPLSWPPILGGIREVPTAELELQVDKVIIETEGRWSKQRVSAALDFLMPRTLYHLPVQRWRKDHASGQPRPLCFDYRMSLRSLERMRATHWHRAWHMRWGSMLENPSANRLYYSDSAKFGGYPIDEVLSDQSWVGLAMPEPPPPRPDPDNGPDELMSALHAGLPVIVWHPYASPEDVRVLVDWILSDDGGFLTFLDRRREANLPELEPERERPFDHLMARDLVVLWDDPERVIVLDQPLIPTQQ